MFSPDPQALPRHDARVARVAATIAAAAEAGQRVRAVRETVSHFVPNPHAPRQEKRPVDVSDLTEILELDVAGRSCRAEAGVTFMDLVRATLPHGLAPKTVPELRTITIGGAVAGCSVESMSYRYGGFHDSCLSYELVDGLGQIQTCARGEEMFELMHGAYGTCGVLTALTFELIPAKPFVRLEHRMHQRFEPWWAELQALCAGDDYAFIDGIIHGPDAWVICLGNFVDEAPQLSDYERQGIYYRSTLVKREDHLTAEQYFFRYDAECHWLTRTLPGFENPIVRRLFGRWILGSTNLIRWSDRVKPFLKMKRRPEVVVDVFIPAARMPEFMSWYVEVFDFFPLWIVPYQMPGVYPWVADAWRPGVGDGFVIDCAVYGKPNSDPEIDWSEVLERKVTELGGVKTLISRNHYTEEAFWRIYDRPRLEAFKAKMDPKGVFDGLYAKFAPRNYDR
ncbi:FAD-binding oxidoreductase [Myxococcota bacterium]|nr:FAD-binding oxidoreductase [Myxococcota bacterium]MBU1899699.1 FAD-binding oxidoreductase [Myxococcota bacterium]